MYDFIHRRLQLLEEVELDSRRELEKQNAEMKSSLAKNSSKISELIEIYCCFSYANFVNARKAD